MKNPKARKSMSNKIEDKKSELLRASGDFEQALNEDLNSLSETAQEWGGRLLLIGGTALVSYLAVRAIFGRKKESEVVGIEDVKSARIDSRNILIKSISDKAALVLLELIREYIVKLLSESTEKHD